MATYLAKWGNKGFLVSPSKIVPLTRLSTGFTLKADSNNDTSGQPTTNTRGLELQVIKLSTTYLAAVGVDPRGQIAEWKAQFGKRYPLLINGQQFGPPLLELTDVQFPNIVTDDRGRFIQVDVDITLQEYVPPTTTVSQKKASTSSTGTNAGAMAATASSTDKSTKKVVGTRAPR